MKFVFCAIAACLSASLSAQPILDSSPQAYYNAQHALVYHPYFSVYAGPHFNYMRLRFTAPNHLDGYAGGLAAGASYQMRYFITRLDFEGTWNASSITGDPNLHSAISEYLVDLNIGPQYITEDNVYALGLFTGFGWDRFNNCQDPNGIDLKYTFNKLFIPLGLFFKMTTSDLFQWGIMGEWRADVWSRMHVLNTSFNNSNASAFRTQIPLTVTFKNCCSGAFLSIIPFYDWSKYGHTNVTSAPDIPALYRWYLGLRILAGYAF